MKILVTPRSVTKNGHPSLDALTRAGYDIVLSTPGQFPTEEELLALLPGCVGYLAGVETISARVLSAATDLKVISRNGTGVDSVDMDAAKKCGIEVCRAQGANARGRQGGVHARSGPDNGISLILIALASGGVGGWLLRGRSRVSD